MTNKNKYGVRPTVRFKHGVFRSRNYGGEGGKIAIIGAFPCVSESLLTFDNIQTAREELNITAGIHDTEWIETSTGGERNYYVGDENNVGDYYPAAAALKWAFGAGTPLEGASEVLVCNITTHKFNANGSIKCRQVPKLDAEGNVVTEDGATVYIDGSPDYNVSLRHENDEKFADINYDKLRVALSKLKGEDFDMLILAYPLEDEKSGVLYDGTSTTMLDNYGNSLAKTELVNVPTQVDVGIAGRLVQLLNFTHDSYTVRNPFGLGIGLRVTPTSEPGNDSTVDESVVDSVINTNKSKHIDEAMAEKYLSIFKDPVHHAHSLYAMIFDDVHSPYVDAITDRNVITEISDADERRIRTGYINPVEAVSAYFCELASERVDTSFTQRPLTLIDGVAEELNFDPTYLDSANNNTDGVKLLAAGGTMFECINRSENTWSVVNSRQPCGYDIAHLRTAAYIIKQIALAPFLGKINYDVTIEAIDSVLATLKDAMIERFPIVESIDHAVRKETSSCVRIAIKINFYGLIIDEIVYVSMEVV